MECKPSSVEASDENSENAAAKDIPPCTDTAAYKELGLSAACLEVHPALDALGRPIAAAGGAPAARAALGFYLQCMPPWRPDQAFLDAFNGDTRWAPILPASARWAQRAPGGCAAGCRTSAASPSPASSYASSSFLEEAPQVSTDACLATLEQALQAQKDQADEQQQASARQLIEHIDGDYAIVSYEEAPEAKEEEEEEPEPIPVPNRFQLKCLSSDDYRDASLASDTESELEAIMDDEGTDEDDKPTDESAYWEALKSRPPRRLWTINEDEAYCRALLAPTTELDQQLARWTVQDKEPEMSDAAIDEWVCKSLEKSAFPRQ